VILEEILFEQFNLKNTNRKIIIFSEWIKVHKLIGQLLRKNKIGFVELNGKVPAKLRGDLIKKFENNPECSVFLSTEAGGSGLNLQVADTLINFELPWNPAKKNQRIGRIDRLGQKSSHLTIYNLITENSIEQQIAAGLMIKQNLFDGVLDSSSKTDYVDFSSKGRSQFIEQLEAFVNRTKEEAETISHDSYEKMEENIEQEDDLAEDFVLADSQGDETGNLQTDVRDISDEQKAIPVDKESKAVELEQVMTSGMQFLSGLFKMSTGKELGLENQKININKETGEVTMTFKLPV
jgi:superfamily II DNA/RNA helicase